MSTKIQWASPTAKFFTVTAGTNLKPDDKVVLIYETGAAFKREQKLVAYLDTPDSTSYNAIATSFAFFGESVEVRERVIQKDFQHATIDNDGFTPVIVQIQGWSKETTYPFGLFLLQLENCPICGRFMMQRNLAGFAGYRGRTQDTQMRRAEIVGFGAPIPGDENERCACEVCTKEGRIHFTCVFCGQDRGTDLLHVTRHQEPICTVCYQTLSAEVYQQKMDALHEKHRYDND